MDVDMGMVLLGLTMRDAGLYGCVRSGGRVHRNRGVLCFVGSVMVISWYWVQVLVTKSNVMLAGGGYFNKPTDRSEDLLFQSCMLPSSLHGTIQWRCFSFYIDKKILFNRPPVRYLTEFFLFSRLLANAHRRGAPHSSLVK